jgi:hypothetical protein
MSFALKGWKPASAPALQPRKIADDSAWHCSPKTEHRFTPRIAPDNPLSHQILYGGLSTAQRDALSSRHGITKDPPVKKQRDMAKILFRV